VRFVRVLGRLCRVAVYGVFVTAVLAFAVSRGVSADIGERGMAVGRELAQFKDLLGGLHHVTLNGESLYVASALSGESMSEVLDRFEAHCAAHSGGLAAQFDALPEKAAQRIAKAAPVAWSRRLGILREVRGSEGWIACLERPDGDGLASVVRRLTAFARSGDLHDVGDLRYVYVRLAEGGKISVVSSLTEGPFRLYDVIGRGLAEPKGSDPPGTPRPPGSKRVISAAVDSGYGTYVFASAAEPPEILAFYDSALPAAGWTRLGGQRDLAVEVWQREGVTMVVHAVHMDGDGDTKVTFAQGRTVAPEAKR
jgi:hypothetical protein